MTPRLQVVTAGDIRRSVPTHVSNPRLFAAFSDLPAVAKHVATCERFKAADRDLHAHREGHKAAVAADRLALAEALAADKPDPGRVAEEAHRSTEAELERLVGGLRDVLVATHRAAVQSVLEAAPSLLEQSGADEASARHELATSVEGAQAAIRALDDVAWRRRAVLRFQQDGERLDEALRRTSEGIAFLFPHGVDLTAEEALRRVADYRTKDDDEPAADEMASSA